jgi:SRSO17 transposase
MSYELDTAGVARLEGYFGQIGACLRDKRKRESFAMYAFGLLSEGERKSAEPIASRACGDETRARNTHDKLLHFLARSSWDDRAVRRTATRYALSAMQQHAPVTTWIVDDTGFLKQGTHSVGVQRQYTGSAGKITNCQVGVSLSVSNGLEHLPIDFDLYVPEDWAADPERRAKAKIPEDLRFQTKIDLALDQIERAVRDGLPGEIVLADADYGKAPLFRETVRLLGFDYAVGIPKTLQVFPVDAGERRAGEARSVEAFAQGLESSAFRRITWREGTRSKLSARFSLRRVKVAQEDGFDPAKKEVVWLLMEWPEGERAPTKFYLTTLPRRWSKKQIVRHVKERWRTERAYEEMKGELGLDHFEGRSFVGWHHHISVVLCCYAFVVAERMRHFPPSTERLRAPGTVGLAA